MICYSDFILSLKPWSYCRLDEPVGYTLYMDSSGNGNHLKPSVEGSVADNRQVVSFTGDPFVSGIRPLIGTQSLSLGSIDFAVRDTALRLDVPLFKSDSWVYRRRVKIQNDLVINSMWFDLIMDTEVPGYHEYMKNWMPLLHSYSDEGLYADHLYIDEEFEHIDCPTDARLDAPLVQRTQPYIMHETFLRFGSLALVGITGVHYDYDGTYMGYSYRLSLATRIFREGEWIEKIVWSRTLVTEDQAVHPAAPLSPGPHRFTAGVLVPTTHSMTIKVSIDGGNQETIDIVLPEDESFVAYDHDTYSTIALMNDTVFSNLSVFFNRPYPTDEWLAASQRALTRDYIAPVSEDLSILHARPPGGFPAIEMLPGSLLNALNGVLLLGTNHRSVIQMFKTAGSTDFTVRITPTIPGITVGSTIKINHNKQSPFSGCWKVYALNTIYKISMTPAIATTVPATITLGATDYDRGYRFTNKDFLTVLITETAHHFDIGNLLTVHHLTDIAQSHTWSVTSVDDDGFTAVARGHTRQLLLRRRLLG